MQVIIIGAGRWSIEVLEVLRAQDDEVIGWLDDRAELQGGRHLGLPVLGTMDFLENHPDRALAVHVAIGHPEARLRCYERATGLGYPLANAIHPSAVVMPSAKLGSGLFLGPCAVISSECVVGDGVVIHMGCTIGHHSTIEDGAFFGSGIHTGGGIIVGRGAFICPGAVLVAGVKIGSGSVVSSGIVVAQEIPSNHCLTRLYNHGLILTEGNIDWPRVVSGVG